MKIHRYILLLTISLHMGLAYGQDINLGLKYSIGKNKYKQSAEGDDLKNSTQSNYALTLGFSPFLSFFSIETSAELQKNDFTDYLTFPLGLRVSLGEKIRFYFQGGAYYSFVLHDNESGYIGKDDAGLRTALGMTFAINKRWRIEAEYTANIGLKSSLQKEIYLPLNQISYDDYTLKSQQLSLAAKYRF